MLNLLNLLDIGACGGGLEVPYLARAQAVRRGGRRELLAVADLGQAGDATRALAGAVGGGPVVTYEDRDARGTATRVTTNGSEIETVLDAAGRPTLVWGMDRGRLLKELFYGRARRLAETAILRSAGQVVQAKRHNHLPLSVPFATAQEEDVTVLIDAAVLEVNSLPAVFAVRPLAPEGYPPRWVLAFELDGTGRFRRFFNVLASRKLGGLLPEAEGPAN